MKKIIIFGCGRLGRNLYRELFSWDDLEVVAFVDNYYSGDIEGIRVYKPDELKNLEYDVICIAATAAAPIMKQLQELGVDRWKMNTSFLMNEGVGAREIFLNELAGEMLRKGIKGSVAEAGVFKGEFASLINSVFNNRKLYLFDTFEGFDERDKCFETVQAENSLENTSYFKETSIEQVMSKMKYPENVIIKKGYIPETFGGVEDDFCFVNLDLDLYQPTFEALRFFYPKISTGGGILIHDYFNEYTFPNLRGGVIEFAESVNANIVPIGDGLSVYITK